MAEADPSTGKKWADRHGLVYGKKFRKAGNIETHLSYSKLHRTGKLLRNTFSKVQGNTIILGNRTNYAKDHNEGVSNSKKAKIKPPYVRGGASAAIMGGEIQARPFMRPSKKILLMPPTLIRKKIRSFGWTVTGV